MARGVIFIIPSRSYFLWLPLTFSTFEPTVFGSLFQKYYEMFTKRTEKILLISVPMIPFTDFTSGVFFF